MSDFWEQAVQIYLTIDRGLFLNSQYVVGEPKVWEGSVDFLALEFRYNTAWMVEVTTSPGAGLKSKLLNFEKEYEWRIRSQLASHDIVSKSGGWHIGLWLFAPEASRSTLKSWMGEKPFQFTSLEEASFPKWESRWKS